MKKANVILVFAVMALLIVSTGAFGNESGVGGKPSAFFPNPSYEFAPVLEGTVIQHDYRVRNRGTADLEIQRVKTG